MTSTTTTRDDNSFLARVRTTRFFIQVSWIVVGILFAFSMVTSEIYISNYTEHKTHLRKSIFSSGRSTTKSNTTTHTPRSTKVVMTPTPVSIPTTQKPTPPPTHVSTTQAPIPDTQVPTPLPIQAPTTTHTPAPVPTTSLPPNVCYPEQVDLPSSSFYSTFVEQRGLLHPPALGVFHQSMCHKPYPGYKISWRNCLPITGRTDEPYCTLPDRMDLLKARPNAKNDLCFGSILHMMMVDLYEELSDIGAKPTILFGTLLGAIRDKGIIPFTEDVDLGYVHPGLAGFSWTELQDRLENKGYYLFDYFLWRVCIAPSHPLASILYDPEYSGLVNDYEVPYVDLYRMKPREGKYWEIEHTHLDRPIPRDKFEPYSKVVINDVEYDSLADPVDLLIHEYGFDYMVPKPHKEDERR